MMNAEAKRLGMSGTHFLNSTGLPGENHLTTVNDLVILAGAIINDFNTSRFIRLNCFKYNNIEQPNRNDSARRQRRRLGNRPHQRGLQFGGFQQAQRPPRGVGGGGDGKRRSARC